jgi:hypothetical protein
VAEQHPIDRMVESIAGWSYSDSLVEVDRKKLRAKLIEDALASGQTMSDEACELFVCGDVDDPELKKLRTAFPKTDAFLEEHW